MDRYVLLVPTAGLKGCPVSVQGKASAEGGGEDGGGPN